MSLYPVPVPPQALDAASSTALVEPGTRAQFKTALGIVEAVYVKNNNASAIGKGLAVAHAWDNDAGPWAVDSAPFASASAARVGYVGVLAAALSAGYYGWAAFRGPFTGGQLAANAASNSLLYVSVNSAALLASVATSVPTAASILAPERYVGIFGATASTLSRASDTPVAGHYVNLFWK